MSIMANAFVNAGLVTKEEVSRREHEERTDREAREAEERAAIRLKRARDRVIRVFPNAVGPEIRHALELGYVTWDQVGLYAELVATEVLDRKASYVETRTIGFRVWASACARFPYAN